MTHPKSFYDVIVVGGSLGALATGALLARRGFRVAWIRDSDPPNAYTYEGITLARAPEAFGFMETPAFRRIVAELALAPVVRRRVSVPQPLYQVVLPRHRIDVPAAPEGLMTELSREFPEVRRPMEEFYASLGRDMADLDALFGADLIWPPESFFERRDATRAVDHGTMAERQLRRDPLGDFPADHPFRTFIAAQVRFATAADPDEPNGLRLLRAHGMAIRASAFLEGGRDALARLLEDKILQHGGESRPRDRIARIVVQRGRVRGVDIAVTDERLGCSFLVTSQSARSTFLLAEYYPSHTEDERVRRQMARYHRFTTSIVLRADGVPTGMAPRVYSVLDRARPLSEENLVAMELSSRDAEGRVRLTTQVLLPRSGVEEGQAYLAQQRERVLGAVGEVIPFLQRNLVLVDSPHDGRPPERRDGGSVSAQSDPWRPEPEAMPMIEAVEPHGFLGVCGLLGRTEIKGLLRVGPQVVPGLGNEGELLAALSAARIITRTDRTKEKLRRELWSKVEA